MKISRNIIYENTKCYLCFLCLSQTVPQFTYSTDYNQFGNILSMLPKIISGTLNLPRFSK